MAKKNQKPKTLADYLRMKQGLKARKDFVQEKYKKSLRAAMGLDKTGKADKEIDFIEKNNVNIGKYSLRTRIRKNPWLKSGRPASSAIKWLRQEVFKQPNIYHYRKLNLAVGHIYTFEYLNPKYKDTLEFFDKYPLILSLGPTTTSLGVRNMGINLHMLPPRVRIVVICQVFEIYKRYYRYFIFFNKDKPVNIDYRTVLNATRKYGVAFAIRMYIPRRQRIIVKFPLRDWHKAIFIPSRGYSGIKAAALIKKWRKFVRKEGFGTSERLNWDKHI